MHTIIVPQQPAQPAQPAQPGQPAAPFGIAPEELARITKLANDAAIAGLKASGQPGSFRALPVGSGPGGVPMNEAEMRALRTQREEMSNQLTNVADRRQELVQELAQTQGAVARQGLESRIEVLDKRIVDIEREMARTGELVMMAPASLQKITARSGNTSTTVPRIDGNWQPNDGTVISLGVVFTLAVLMPIAITASRIWWRRAIGTLPARQQKAENERFEKLEQAVDSIAIEMERVSEGQRFVTRLLTEGRGESPVFGNAAREPVAVSRGANANEQG